MSKMFAYDSIPRGNRLMVETCSGTDSGYCADLAERCGVELPQPDSEHIAQWVEALPSIATPINPVDVTMMQWGNRAAQANTLLTMLEQPADAAALIINYLSEDSNEDWDCAVLAMVDVRKQVNIPCFVITNLPEGAPRRVRELLLANDVVPLQGMEDAVSCIGQAARHSIWCARLRERGGPEAKLVGTGELQPHSTLNENQSKRELSAMGVSVPASQLCSSSADAVRFARQLGYPVVLKAHGDGFIHKTELGAVVLNLGDDAAVDENATKLLELSGVSQISVEEMVTDAVAEMLVGVSRDPTLGLGLTIGTGGIFTQVVNDTVTLLLPVTREDIRDELACLRGSIFLDGYRGRPVADTEALVEAIAAIAAYAESRASDLLEMDVNPILVRPQGRGAVAVDALIRLGVISSC